MTLSEIQIYFIIPLIFGSYIFTFYMYRILSGQIERLVQNHLRHIEEALEKYGIRVESSD